MHANGHRAVPRVTYSRHPVVGQQNLARALSLHRSCYIFDEIGAYLTSAGILTPVCLDPDAICRLICTAFVALQNPSSATDSLSYLTFLLTYLPSGLNAKCSSALPESIWV